MDGIRATPYINPLLGSANDIIGGLLGYMRDPRRTQQLQGLAGLLESTGIPKTVERLAYGEPLTNIQRANVPLLRPETAEALLTVAPVPPVAGRAAMAAGRAGERMAERMVPQIMERGGMPAGLLEGMSSRTVSPLTVYHGSPAKFSRFDPTKIGSGEGAQAYGYGHYVAEAPETANQYKEMLKSKAFSKIVQRDRNVYDVVAPDGTVVSQGTPLGQAHKAKDAYDANVGSIYEIDLPDEQIARMLDWDKPLSQQKDVMAALNNVAENNVKARVRNEIENQIRASGVLPADQTGDDYMSLLFGQSEETITKANQMLKQLADEQMAKIDLAPLVKSELEGMKPATMTWDATGKEFYEMLAQRRGSPETASALFREQGIPGIRYLDQGSRATPNITNQRLADLYEKHQGNAEAAVDEMMRSVYNTPKKKQEMREAFLKQLEAKKTSNFVVFPGNEDLLTILKRNGGLLGP